MLNLALALLPIALYLIWLIRARRRAAAAGAAPPGIGEAPWGALLLASALLAGVLMGGLALWDGMSPALPYQPPKLIDGRIQPGGAAPPPPQQLDER